MARMLLTSLALSLVAALAAATTASATGCGELQEALTTAPPGGVVEVDQGAVCGGNYTLPAHQITLQGIGTGATFDPDTEGRSLTGTDVGRTVIRNLAFRDGAEFIGGAIQVSGDSPLTIENARFENNQAFGGGAVAIQNSSGEPVAIRDSAFGREGAGNGAIFGGGGLFVNSIGDVELAGNTFEDNAGGGIGGGAALVLCGRATINGNRFLRNSLSPSGFGGPPTALRALGEQPGGNVEGAGLHIQGQGCEGLAARARALGGEAPFQVEQSANAFAGNVLDPGTRGTGRGAGELIRGASLSSTGDTFDANAIEGPIDEGFGGGLAAYPDGGQAVVARNLVATRNTMADGEGGGIDFHTTGDGEPATLTLVHATVAGNDVGTGRGAAIDGGEFTRLVLHNSIVYGNTGEDGAEISGFFEPSVEERLRSLGGEVVPDRDVRFTLACDEGEPLPGEGNLCADPRLEDVAGGKIDQTAASPSRERASAALVAGLTNDYAGDGRQLDSDGSGAAEPDMGADEALAPAAVTPAPATQTQTQGTTPAGSGGVLGTSAERCVSRRLFRIKLRNRGRKVRSATVLVDGKRVKVVRGKRLTSRVNLRGLPKGRFTVRIVLRLADGGTIEGVRRYRTCTPPRPHGVPPV